MEHPWIAPSALGLCLLGATIALATDPRTPAAAATAAGKPAGAAPAAAPPAAGREKLNQVRGEQIGADKEAIAAQQRINHIDDERQNMLVEYRKALADTESHQAYADQLGRQIQSQSSELADIQRQLDEIEDTSRSIVPLEQKMLATLREFVRLDVPFLLEERGARIATLETMMDRADVSISEKYRRILEAYQVEMDYGRTTESYEGKLPDNQQDRTVRFLRIGRVSLLYQTIDGAETGYWDAGNRQWLRNDHYAHAFKQGVAVAQKLSAPELLLTPIAAPVEAHS